MIRILFIAPGDNPHTWKWVGWFGRKYPGEIALLPYQAAVPHSSKEMLAGVEILEPHIPPFRIASLGSWREFGRVRRLVRRVQPRLLHALWAYGSGSYAARCKYHPFVLSPWGSDITIFPRRGGLKGAMQRYLIVEALERADRLTATSGFLRDAIHALVPGRERPDVFPYGVDTSVFDPEKAARLEFEWPDGAPQGPEAVTVGFFKGLKRVYAPDLLLEAVARASEEVPELRCVIGGSGEMRDALEGQARSLGVEDRICFPGWVPYSDMPRALAAIDIAAMPSRYEAFGVVALEASAMARPVILSRKWGMVEVAEEGVTGYFIEPGDVDALTERLVQLSRDPELRARMGAAGREFVRRKYEFERIMEAADRYCSEIIREFS